MCASKRENWLVSCATLSAWTRTMKSIYGHASKRNGHLQRRYLVAKRDKYEAGVRNLIVAGMRSGEFASCDPALTVRAILGSLNWSVQWFNPEGPLTSAEIAEKFADYLIRGLLAKPGASYRLPAGKESNRSLNTPGPREARLPDSIENFFRG